MKQLFHDFSLIGGRIIMIIDDELKTKAKFTKEKKLHGVPSQLLFKEWIYLSFCAEYI